MLVHSSSTWSFLLPLWVRKCSRFYIIIYFLIHDFVSQIPKDITFYLTGHSDCNRQRTSVCVCGHSIYKLFEVKES